MNIERLKNLSTGEIKEKYLYKTNDVFMFWACIEKLVDRCDLVLRDPKLLQTINRLAGREVFVLDDHKKLSNDEFNEKFANWVKNTPELGAEKSDLWTEKAVAESMAKADEDYIVYTNKAVKNPEEFKTTISEHFADFRNKENLSAIDKGYVLAFLRKAIKNKALNENLRTQLLIHGAAIGFISSADLIKMKEDFNPSLPLFKKLESYSFEDFKKWSAKINGGKIPNTNKGFVKENDAVLKSLFVDEEEVETPLGV